MSVASKYSELGYKLLPGSMSGPSYLVFAQDEKTGATVGAKLILQGLSKDGERYLMVGLRIRMVADPDGKVIKPGRKTKFAEAAHWDKAFPKFSWSQTSGIRRSMVQGVVLKRGPEDLWMLPYDLKAIGYYDDLQAWFQERIPRKSWALNQEALVGFVRECIEQALVPYPPPTNLDPKVELAAVEAALEAAKIQLQALEAKKVELTEKVASGAEVSPEDAVTKVAHLVTKPLTSDEINAILTGQPAPAAGKKKAVKGQHLKLVEKADDDDTGDEEGADGEED